MVGGGFGRPRHRPHGAARGLMADLRDPKLPASAVIEALDLLPHPEGGHYREIWRDRPIDGSRGTGTAIYFLLSAGERSHWHKVDAAEAWHWYAGSPLLLSIAGGVSRSRSRHRLGAHLGRGEEPFAVVPAHYWQSAESLGAWTLVGCTVSPAFEFTGFEMAPPGWEPAP